jgi:hypothetical protein
MTSTGFEDPRLGTTHKSAPKDRPAATRGDPSTPTRARRELARRAPKGRCGKSHKKEENPRREGEGEKKKGEVCVCVS